MVKRCNVTWSLYLNSRAGVERNLWVCNFYCKLCSSTSAYEPAYRPLRVRRCGSLCTAQEAKCCLLCSPLWAIGLGKMSHPLNADHLHNLVKFLSQLSSLNKETESVSQFCCDGHHLRNWTLLHKGIKITYLTLRSVFGRAAHWMQSVKFSVIYL